MNLRQRCGLELFKDYDCIIDYHLGKANVVADAFSRKMISTLSLNHYDWRFEYDGALLAQLRVIPDLKMMIRDSQKNDGNRGLFYESRLCVSNDMELKKKLMYEATIPYLPCILEVTRCTKI